MISKHAKGGFSLIEIMIAIAILAIVAVSVGPTLFRQVDKARISRVKTDLKTIQGGIDLYNAHTSRYPETLRDLVKSPTEEEIARKWDGPYLKGKDVPKDPWGKKYHYELTEGQEHPYSLYAKTQEGKQISVWDEE